MYSVIKVKELIEVARVRTPEEAYHLLGQWMRKEPDVEFTVMEVA